VTVRVGVSLEQSFVRNYISVCELVSERCFLHRRNSRLSDTFGNNTGFPEALDVITPSFDVVLYLSVYEQKFPCSRISLLSGNPIKTEKLSEIEQEASRM